MKLTKLKLPKADLLKVLKEERVYLVLASHFLNDINTLQRCMYFSNRKKENETERKAQTSQSLFFARLLAGKQNECWEMLKKSFFSSKLSKKYESKLTQEGKQALSKLKSYFSKENLIYKIRNDYEFHAPDGDRIDGLINNCGDNEVFEMFLGEHHGNTRLTISDVLVGFSLINEIGKNPQEAMNKIIGEILNQVKLFQGFLAESIFLILDEYDIKDMEEVEIPEPPYGNDITIPCFIKKKDG